MVSCVANRLAQLGGDFLEGPSANLKIYSYQNEPTWSKSENAIARRAFDAALEAGTSGRHAESKADGKPDQGPGGPVGVGALPHRTP